MLRLAPIVPIVLWALIYPARMVLAHLRFATNAHDLSIFDYALWNLRDGGFVPFVGKSLWLGCKEDVAIYVASFGVLMWFRGDRRAAMATVAGCSWPRPPPPRDRRHEIVVWRASSRSG